MKILITSDFHGNPRHAERLPDLVRLTNPDIFVYAGDLSPARHAIQEPDAVVAYLEEFFFSVIKGLPVEYKFVMPGNTDYAVIAEYFQAKYKDPCDGLRFVRDEVWPVAGLDLCFLSTVGFTTHCLKDVEAYDKFGPVPRCNHFVFTRHASLDEEEGYIECEDGLQYSKKHFEVYLSPNDVPEHRMAALQDTVYDRLQRLVAKCTQKTLLFSHTPPRDTCADVVRKNQHVGSMDIRKCIEDASFDMVVSGHIHQSVYTSGKFEDTIGQTKVLTIGNTGIDRLYMGRMAAIIYDTDTKIAERIELICVPDFTITLERHFERYNPDEECELAMQKQKE